MSEIKYPYMPEGRTITYVPASNDFMREARRLAIETSLDKAVKTGAVVVAQGEVIGRGANGSDYHETHQCERVRLGLPSGQGYELCEGCSPKNHAEPKAIRDAQSRAMKTAGADLYLWGHWWCCKDCWDAMIEGGIKNVYLLEGSEIFFDKNNPENLLGQWDKVPK